MEDLPEKDAQHAYIEQQRTQAEGTFLHNWRRNENFPQKWEELLYLVETIPQLVWVAQPDGFNTAFNRRWYEYTGAAPGEHQGEMWIDALHPDDRARALTAWYHSLETGELYEIEYRLREGKTGEYHWFLARALPFSDNEGHILSWFGTCTNIEKLKRAEKELRQSRDAFRFLLDALPQLVWTTYPDETEEYRNHYWVEYTGLPLEDLQESKWISCFHPDDREKILTLWHNARLTSQPFEREVRLREGKTGTYRWFLSRGIPLFDHYGKVWRWIGTCTDIHEQKCTEEALRESELRFRGLMDANIIGIAIADINGHFLQANKVFLSLMGYSLQDMQSGRMRWTRMTPPEYRELDQQAATQLLETGSFAPFEKEYWTKDGRRVPVLIGGAFPGKEGERSRLLAFVLDVTARKALEKSQDEQ